MAILSQKRGKIRLEKATAEEIFATLKISDAQIRWAKKAVADLAPPPAPKAAVRGLSRPARRGKSTPTLKKRAKR